MFTGIFVACLMTGPVPDCRQLKLIEPFMTEEECIAHIDGEVRDKLLAVGAIVTQKKCVPAGEPA